MGDQSAIEWTDATWNPIRARNKVTGKVGWICVHKSAGCENCYAEDMNAWRGNGEPFTPSGLRDVEPFLDEKILTAPLRWRTPRKVFVCSMTDLFGEWVPDEWIDRIFAVMLDAQRHTFQILTKRPERMLAYLSQEQNRRNWIAGWFKGNHKRQAASLATYVSTWPLPNVHLGVSVENQAAADERIPLLLETPAAVRWISAEPLLGPLDLSPWLPPKLPALDWIVVGGES